MLELEIAFWSLFWYIVAFDLTIQDDKNANVVEQKQPVQIALAHELIHSLRGMKGSRKKAGMGTNKMPGANNEYWRQEKFDTVGIDHIRDDGSYADAANWYFTENTIRREQGFYWRAKYA